MSLPPLVPVPPAKIRFSIAPEEWEACLGAWISLTDSYLRLPSKQLSAAAAPEGSLVRFLHSFYREAASSGSKDGSLFRPSTEQLKKTCFRLVQRLCLEIDSATGFLDFDFLAAFCRVHSRSAVLARLMNELWKIHEKTLQDLLQKRKIVTIEALESQSDSVVQSDLRQVADIILASPKSAALFMTGSDFLDALTAAYETSNDVEESKTVAATTYLGLVSLTKINPPNLSLLTDHLFSLQAQADRKTSQTALLSELVTNTSLISKLLRITGGGASDRLPTLLHTLETYRSSSIARKRDHLYRKPNKGKGRLLQNHDEMHMHRMSLVTQIQDLFPDLGSGFVLKLLDEYGDNVEQVTAHLLENTLPAHLRDLDRMEEVPVQDTSQQIEIEHIAPRSTPPLRDSTFPERRNVFDDDEFDRLEFDASRLHIGKKAERPSEGQANKAAILSALAAFDSDDDERDDTYDVEDVGGTVDTSHPDGEPGPAAKVAQEENEMALFTAYKSSPELFGRTFNVRKGQARQSLKVETGMTDEAIEGWAIMLQRDPKRLKRLEEQFGAFDGNQSMLPRTAYRQSPGETETEDSDVPAGSGGFRGRGRGRGRGVRGGGNVAGLSSDPNTAAAQRRKEASKGSRANHNRRDQRAKKMARGGFAG